MSERPDIESLVGANNIDMMKDNHANHVRFIASLLKNHDPEYLLKPFCGYSEHIVVTDLQLTIRLPN